MANKRTRSDSATAAIQAMKNAGEDTLQPPPHAGLEKKAEPFWHDNIRSKALDSWTPADLLAAVELANNQLAITRLRRELRKKMRVSSEERDEKALALVRNDIVTLQRTVLAQRRDLQIHSHASNGETRDQRKRNDNDRKARSIVDAHQAEEGNLIAFPQH
ncbi:terminase [Sodalis sp.]|uniref:terminase n=1 Tax=Sodalis sp. (in: enterobacteria) TaxID=1898979 RepID=UPI0038733EE6